MGLECSTESETGRTLINKIYLFYIEETQDTVVEDVFLGGELFADDEEERPIFTEQYVENLEQE